jgi:hypothetical protein
MFKNMQRNHMEQKSKIVSKQIKTSNKEKLESASSNLYAKLSYVQEIQSQLQAEYI